MSSETFSVIVSCWYDALTRATRLKVVRIDTSEEVQLSEGSFLLRISRDENASVERCFIRHIASGREAYVQGGPHLQTFVKACIVQSPKSVSASSSPERPEEMPGESQRNSPASQLEPSTPGEPEEDANTSDTSDI